MKRERDLLARARTGDVEAFEQLYRDHVGRVYAVCLRMTGDPSEAEEATQEAFVRAWQKLETFRGTSAFSTWLHRLTVNVVLSGFRSKHRRTSRVTVTDRLETLEREGSGPRADLRADLEWAIASLPEGARRIFVLHDVEGYKHREIAEMTGLAAGTCKAQLHRARKLLREALG